MLAGETPFTGKVIELIRLHSTVEPINQGKESQSTKEDGSRGDVGSGKGTQQSDHRQRQVASALRAGAEG